MCLCLHQLQTLLCIPRGTVYSLHCYCDRTCAPPENTTESWSNYYNNHSSSNSLAENPPPKRRCRDYDGKNSLYIVPQSTSKVNVASSAYHFITVWMLLKGMSEEEESLAYASLLVGHNSLSLVNIVFRFDPLIYVLFSSLLPIL